MKSVHSFLEILRKVTRNRTLRGSTQHKSYLSAKLGAKAGLPGLCAARTQRFHCMCKEVEHVCAIPRQAVRFPATPEPAQHQHLRFVRVLVSRRNWVKKIRLGTPQYTCRCALIRQTT